MSRETVEDSSFDYVIRIESKNSFWRRAWFLISAVPRYLVTGNVRLP